MKAKIAPRITTENRTQLQDVIPLSTPYLVFLDPCNLCNFSCKFCPTGNREIRKYRTGNRIMGVDLYEKIINDLNDMPEPIKVLRLYKDGEPLINSSLPWMISLAKESGRILSVDTTTNASLLNPIKSRQLIDAGLDRLFISIEGMSAARYKEFSGYTLDWDKFVDNIADFYGQSRGRCEVVIKTVAENLEKGEDEKFYQTFGDISDRIFIEHTAPCWGEFDIQNKASVGIYGQPTTNVKVCPYIFYSTSINADGRVSLCFLDWRHRMIIGDLKKQSFNEVWNERELRWYRGINLVGKRGLLPRCKNCGQLTHGAPDDIDKYASQILAKMRG